MNDPSQMFNGDETSLFPKTEKVLPQKNNSAVGFLCKWSDSGPNNFLPYVLPAKDVVNSLPENWFLGKYETGCDPFFEYIASGVRNWLNEYNI